MSFVALFLVVRMPSWGDPFARLNCRAPYFPDRFPPLAVLGVRHGEVGIPAVLSAQRHPLPLL